MWGDYKDAVKTVIPGVPIVVDKFHVFEHIYDDFTEIRKRLSLELNSTEKAIIKGNWRLLNHNAANLDFRGQQKLKQILDTIPIFKELHSIKENFAEIYNSQNRKEGEHLFEEWIKRASQFEEFTESIAMIFRWHEYIFNWYDYNVINATTEALNRLAKGISAKGRGCIYDVLKAKIIYASSTVKSAKFEFRPVNNVVNFRDAQISHIGYTTPWKPASEKFEKHIVAVSGTDIEELMNRLSESGFFLLK